MFEDTEDGCTNCFCACRGTRTYERGICSTCGGLWNRAPRVEALIERVMREHPGIGRTAQATYYEAVHQELAPLARELEQENGELRDALEGAVAWADTAQGRAAPQVDGQPGDWINKARELMGPNAEITGG